MDEAVRKENLAGSLVNLVMVYIGKGILNGVNYFLIRRPIEGSYDKVKKYKEALAIYEEEVKEVERIKKEAAACGYAVNTVIRTLEASNGMVYVIDRNRMYQLAIAIAKIAIQEDPELLKNGTRPGNILGDHGEAARKEEIERLSRKVIKAVESRAGSGKVELEVALFNKNSTNKIEMTCLAGETEDMVKVTYDAYRLTVYDIEEINKKHIGPKGYLIKDVVVGEILPRNSGIRVTLKVVKRG
jgi:hypothetical protein